jgi:Flp pilus assembly protein TadD
MLKELIKMQTFAKTKEKRKVIYENLIKKQLTRTVAVMKNSPYPWAETGIAALNAGNSKDGEQYFKKAVELSPERSLYYENLAQCQIKNGKTQEAEINHKKAVKLFPQAHLQQKK